MEKDIIKRAESFKKFLQEELELSETIIDDTIVKTDDAYCFILPMITEYCGMVNFLSMGRTEVGAYEAIEEPVENILEIVNNANNAYCGVMHCWDEEDSFITVRLTTDITGDNERILEMLYVAEEFLKELHEECEV